MNIPTEKIDRLFEAWSRPDSPGCSLAVLYRGEVVYKKGYGMANLEYDVPITPQTIFHVASVSKQFTAMAVTLLAQSGELGLDDEVRKYIPELPGFGSQITIRHLLHHTSGLRDQWELLILAGWRMEDVIKTADILELIEKQEELNFEPGSEYLYCNTGYTLLALIVERVSGQSFRQFCKEKLFEPLGMRNTHFHDDHTEIVQNRAYSYMPKEGGGFKHAVLSYATVGASSLFTTTEDLACWDESFYTGPADRRAAIDQMHDQGVLNSGDIISYAFGLMVTQYRGLKVVEHSGGDAGFRSHLLRFPDQHFSVVILSNLGIINPGNLSRQISDHCLEDIFQLKGEAAEKPDKTYLSAVTPAALERYAGVYFNAHRVESRRLEIRAGKLYLAAGPGFEMLPFSRDRFKLAAFPDYDIRFNENDRGDIGELLVATPGAAPIAYTRLAPVDTGKDNLKDYTGEYICPELGVNAFIEIQDDQLGIRRRKYPFSILKPTIADGFAAENLDILFERDPDHSISGFKLSTGRVRNLKYIKKPEGGGEISGR